MNREPETSEDMNKGDDDGLDLLNQEIATCVERIAALQRGDHGCFQEIRERYEAKKVVVGRIRREKIIVVSKKKGPVGRFIDKLFGYNIEEIDAAFDEEVSKMNQKLEIAKNEFAVEETALRTYEFNQADLPKQQSLLQDLVNKKVSLLLQKDSNETHPALIESHSRQKALSLQVDHLQTTISSGERALVLLNSARRELKNAANLGTMDMLGGGPTISMFKRNKIHNAKSLIDRAQIKLKEFRSGLTGMKNVCVDTSGLDDMAFMDVWLDNILTDMHVQKQIRKALDSCNNAISQVQGDLTKVKKQEVHVQESLIDNEKLLQALAIRA